jgi:membrane protein
MVPLLSFFQQLQTRATSWAWRAWQPVEKTPLGRFITDTVLALRSLRNGFQGDNIRLRSAALTYISVFSLVPLLTVALTLLGVYHQEAFQRRLRAFIFAVLAPGVREESTAFVEQFLAPAYATTIGGIGFLTLLVSAGSLLHNIDVSLNDIWGVRHRRPWYIRVLIYAALLVLGPLALALSFTGTGQVRSLLEPLQMPFIPWLFDHFFSFLSPLTSVGGLTLLYFLTPNTHVRFRSALAGGLVAGVAWWGARLGYSEFAAYSFRYNPVYGSLGFLPLFLVWLYVSWMLVLFGARLSYVVEHASFRDSLFAFGSHPRARELVGARVAQEATVVWFEGGPPPLPRDLATQLRVPEPLVQETVDDLAKAGLIQQGRRGGIVLTRNPAELTLADLTLAVHGVYNPVEPSAWSPPRAPGFESLLAFFSESDQHGLEVLRRTRWVDLAMLVRPELATAAAGPAPSPQVAASAGNP